MELLLSHWHCLLPGIGIIAALFIMRGQPKDSDNEKREKP